MTASAISSWKDRRLKSIREWENANPFHYFIDEDKIQQLLRQSEETTPEAALDVVAKAKANATTGAMLSPEDVAVLANAKDPAVWEAVFDAADWIKRTVYGNRIVLFAPLYISSPCVNECLYCGFRTGNTATAHIHMDRDTLIRETESLVDQGQKRLVVVYGEHRKNDVDYMCETIDTVYSVRKRNGEIRRVNVNAAPLSSEEYWQIRSVGIGTYQIFQETYHRKTYRKVHPEGTLKGEYDWRLFGLHRALEQEIDDVALGVLFGLYDWRFELLALLHHAMALEKEFGIGPHTISYPRLNPALNTPLTRNSPYLVSDEDFVKIVAIIRLMCPYTGSILTAREEPELRRKVIRKGGVSQCDAGSRIDLGGYSGYSYKKGAEQFSLKDKRSLDDFILDLCREGYLPSFCTAGYREGRTGANFMPLAKSATVNQYCIANGVLSFKEYLLDYASPEVAQVGEDTILPKYLDWLSQHAPQLLHRVKEKLASTESEERDLHI